MASRPFFSLALVSSSKFVERMRSHCVAALAGRHNRAAAKKTRNLMMRVCSEYNLENTPAACRNYGRRGAAIMAESDTKLSMWDVPPRTVLHRPCTVIQSDPSGICAISVIGCRPEDCGVELSYVYPPTAAIAPFASIAKFVPGKSFPVA